MLLLKLIIHSFLQLRIRVLHKHSDLVSAPKLFQRLFPKFSSVSWDWKAATATHFPYFGERKSINSTRSILKSTLYMIQHEYNQMLMFAWCKNYSKTVKYRNSDEFERLTINHRNYKFKEYRLHVSLTFHFLGSPSSLKQLNIHLIRIQTLDDWTFLVTDMQ